MDRPGVDVVVPVAASAAGLQDVLARMRGIALRAGDTLTVVDNRDVGVPAPEVLVAQQLRTSYFARNAGAARGSAPWLLFLDADVDPPATLLDDLLGAPIADDVGVLAGGVIDQPPGERASAAVRYAARKRSMAQDTTLAHGRWAFAQTANAAVRRSAFEAVGGFCPRVRSGGDADLGWRLRDLGWRLEARPDAAVVHRSRTTVPRLLANRFRHGSGAGWLAEVHAGAFPARRWPGLLLWGTRRFGAGVAAAARGDRDAAIEGMVDGPAVWAFELGRLVPNRPLGRGRDASRGLGL
jgi:hypothetical protein